MEQAKTKIRTIEMAKKRIPPIFRLTMSDKVKLETVYNNPKIQEIVMEELVDAIKDGLNRGKHSVNLFQIADSTYQLEIEKPNWKPSLSNALNYYKDKEDYVKCAAIRDLIKQL